MRKSLLGIAVLSWLLMFVYRSHAQEKVWSVGPEIGINVSSYGMDADENEDNTGIAGGVFFTYSVISTFALTTKFLYSEKGADLGSHQEILKYFEVPIIGRFFLNREGRFRPNLFLGPSFGLLRGVSTRTGTADPVKVLNFDQTYNKYDIGATGGVGLNYLIFRHTRALLDARYTHGLTDLSKAPGQINNETITVTFGLSFGI